MKGALACGISQFGRVTQGLKAQSGQAGLVMVAPLALYPLPVTWARWPATVGSFRARVAPTV
jgi:hypothetical protein